MKNSIFPSSTIGILGGGQLGKMMAVEAKLMGFQVAVLDPAPNGPCAQVADIHIQAALDDIHGAIELAKHTDVITYEFENVDIELAKELEARGKLPQGHRALEMTQDRGNEKQALTEAGVPVAPYRLIERPEQLQPAIAEIGYPCVLKTTRGGYDGKGQWKLECEADVKAAEEAIQTNGNCVLEAWLPFDKEISVVMTRGRFGEITLFPIPENIHEDHMLKQSIVPARVEGDVVEKAKKAALRIAEHIQFIGTFAVEMFVVNNGIYVNEMAPRPHNSGHYTIEACSVSQFGQHIRAICGLPLLEVKTPYAAVMTNVIGEDMHKYLQQLEAFEDCFVHLYGKDAVKPKRKMGHVTKIGQHVENLVVE
ncbi:5-(carboxyamino)imidazole ribonucleotide synthase [Pontibacillus litoralis]|uniref:N5-carboxyaminoimidazole ribonucleotide synthase n=1 Tax=Pontibacillus litoralis JSM 072002 TaxID=1385512 RepID=A0A0A5G549_9BACI|nr:5-(carboxyamino)imidazole ribonucleotide synthase [Pontibacillus litoralis]KGX88251.1 phosphoribosylaminoimidazole carboxylase [Pontibacillus litoralis JSM 072002]